jgi:hypothetical protein
MTDCGSCGSRGAQTSPKSQICRRSERGEDADWCAHRREGGGGEARSHERRLTAVPAPVECLPRVHDMVDAGEGDAALLPR